MFFLFTPLVLASFGFGPCHLALSIYKGRDADALQDANADLQVLPANI